MRLFICRHGNTFGPDQQGGEKIFMCGSKNNIPLVNTGREQARRMAKYLHENKITPAAIYANQLIRVWEFAVIIKEYFHHLVGTDIPLIYDERLLELDYGEWAGLSEQEVIAKFGEESWNAWQQRRITLNSPPNNWQITSEEVIANIRSLLGHLETAHKQNETILMIGSQGSMTFLNAVLPGGMEVAIKDNHFKVKTGHFVEIEKGANGWRLIHWNKNPS